MSFGQFIRLKRQEANLTQAEVASHLGYEHPMMVSYLESDQRHWTLEHIILLAGLFNMPVWKLMKEWSESLPKST